MRECLYLRGRLLDRVGYRTRKAIALVSVSPSRARMLRGTGKVLSVGWSCLRSVGISVFCGRLRSGMGKFVR